MLFLILAVNKTLVKFIWLKHSQCGGTNEKLILIGLQWAHLFYGIEKLVLTDVTTDIEYAENPYILSLCEGLRKINGAIIFSKHHKSEK